MFLVLLVVVCLKINMKYAWLRETASEYISLSDSKPGMKDFINKMKVYTALLTK